MTIVELGRILGQMYGGAPEREAVVMIHLFGVRYADQIKQCGGSIRDVVRSAGIPESYGAEVTKAVNLARYVKER